MLTRNKRRQTNGDIPEIVLPDAPKTRAKKQKKAIAEIAAVVEPMLQEVVAPVKDIAPAPVVAKSLPRFEKSNKKAVVDLAETLNKVVEERRAPPTTNKRDRPPAGFYNQLDTQLDLENTLAKYLEEHKDLDDEQPFNPDEEHLNLFSPKEREYLKTLDPQTRLQLFKVQDELRALTPNIPQKCRVMLMPIPLLIKDEILRKMNLLEDTDTSATDYMRTKKWIDDVLRIPFGKYRELPIKFNPDLTGVEAKAQQESIESYLKTSREEMDEFLWGQNEIKEAGIDFISKKIRNPRAQGKILSLEGPPGVGKTTFGRHIAKSLKKEFVFIPLGGATHGSLLDGDQEKWVGSRRGAILDGLIRTQTMDPVFFFDEVDKVSATDFGAEITSVLTMITDPSQNSEFYDKQFIDIPLDLSNCIMIFSFNDRNKVPPILRDRMDIRIFKDYRLMDRVRISQKHIIPTIIKDIGMINGKLLKVETPTVKHDGSPGQPDISYVYESPEIIINEDVIKYVIHNRSTEDEKGLRTIKRILETICEKANRLIMSGQAKTIPIKITQDFIENYVPRPQPPVHLTYIR